MGTNYYLVTEEGRKHIGKSSGGWCFSLHVYPEEDINDLQDWIPFWNQLTPDKHIEDEYGAIITGEGMLIIICERKIMCADACRNENPSVLIPARMEKNNSNKPRYRKS